MLRDNENILAYPQYFRGNVAISEHTIKSVVQFYREDGISRVSASSKDILQINKKSVPVRFYGNEHFGSISNFQRASSWHRWTFLILFSSASRSKDLLTSRHLYVYLPWEHEPIVSSMCSFPVPLHLILCINFTIVLERILRTVLEPSCASARWEIQHERPR